jgi:DNA polymerase-3 subunit gamma/tau
MFGFMKKNVGIRSYAVRMNHIKLVERNAFLKSDLPSSLRIFNEIMDHGFEGQHFIIGLGEHLRNLLVCKDPQTVNLLEVGETIKAKYLQQSQACSVPFLIKALGINNQCDLDYKNANNKRLSVEIALMQIASFFLPEIDVKPEPPAFIAPSQSPAKTSESQTKADDSQPKVSSTPPPPETPVQQPVKPTPISTISLKAALADPSKQETEKEPIAENSQKLTFEDVQNAWKAYIEANSHDPAFLTVLQTSELRLNEQTLEIVIASQVQEAFLLQKKSDLMSFLRSKLSNALLHLKTIVNETKAQEILHKPSEKFAKLSEKNPELKRLREVLDLDIQY